MAHHEVPSMHELPLDRFWVPLLDRESLRRVVALVAVGLRVASLAELLLFRRGRAVYANEVPFVTEKRPRQQPDEIAPFVARRAFTAIPLCRVFVAAEAFLHRRDLGSIVLDDPGVTGHALTADVGEYEVTVVIERDLTIRTIRRRGEHAAHLLPFACVTLIAQRHLWKLVRAVHAARRMAARTRQALWLPRPAAFQSGEMQSMRKARRHTRAACRDDGGENQREGE
jgi:hypothetical protein